MSNSLPDVLTRWVYSGRYTVAQLAEWAGCGTSLVYKYMEGEREMPFDRVARVSRQASRLHGDNDLATLLLAPAYEVTERGEAAADGSIDDEVTDAVQTLGRLATAHRSRDRLAMDAEIAQAEAVLNRVKAERDRL